MSTEKRLVLFLVLSVATMYATRTFMDRLGLLPKPAPVVARNEPKKDEGPAKPVVEPKDQPKAAPADEAKPKPGPKADEKVAIAKESELLLGSATDKTPDGYRLEVQLDQKGAGVAAIRSSRWEANVEGIPRKLPLDLIVRDPRALPSFVLNLSRPRTRPGPDADPVEAALPDAVPLTLEDRIWEVVRDDQGRAIRPITRAKSGATGQEEGQEIVFRTTAGDPRPVTLTRQYRLWHGEDAFEFELKLECPDGDQTLSYELMGPHGIPIEGEWYTGTFRDVFFGGVAGAKNEIMTISANDVARHQNAPERFTRLPLAFAGIENQYFTVFVQPVPRPASMEQSWIKEATPLVIHEDPNVRTKADVSVELISKPLPVGRQPVTHRYQIYAGPKTYDALAAVGAPELSVYRKGWSLWVVGDMGASFLSQHFIGPMLNGIYAVTASISHVFGGTKGNYGIAIILLTMTVRLILFPLGRKQAKSAKKMQDMQPLLNELKAKYKDDKEAMAREQFALFRKHGVNPMGGCLLVFIQLPVLVGLWQALNNSVALRHSTFLWIRNLAAPDMLFKFPGPIPLIGGWLGPYFNLLPLLVVALMLLQTKLFSPPATTPEMEQQQKMMKFMMIFMMFMFYKVPSGLSIYLITSSLWQVGERLLLPKASSITSTVPPPSESDDRGNGKSPGTGGGPSGGGKGRPPGGNGSGGWWSDLRDRAQQILDDADKQRTVRNPGERRDRDRPRPRPGPGRKR